MIVLEVTGLDPSAERLLWQWLFSMDLVTTVEGRRGPNPHPLQHWLRAAPAGADRAGRPVAAHP